MDKVEKQIALIYNGSENPDTEDLIKHLIGSTLRVHQDHEEGGKVYFAIDYKEGIDFGSEPDCDVLLFENIDTKEAKEEARRLVSKANKGARIFVPLGSDFITKDMLGLTQTLFTYAMSDQRANVCTNRIQTLPDGSFSCDVVYQATPAGRKRGLRDKLFPTYNQNMFGKAMVNSTVKDDILKAVKAFAFGMALSVESKYVSEAIGSFIFPSMEKVKRDEALRKTEEEKHFSREKEIDFD